MSWIDWTQAEDNGGLVRFTRELIAFRRRHPALRRTSFFSGAEVGEPADVRWHGPRLNAPDWDGRTLAMHLSGEHSVPADEDIYFAINASGFPSNFNFPRRPPAPAGLSSLIPQHHRPATFSQSPTSSR